MKTRIRKTVSLLPILIGMFGCINLNSCAHDKEKGPSTANGSLILHLHTNVDTSEIGEYDSVSLLGSDRKIKVHLAQLYLSGIQLIKADGSTYDVAGVNVLKTMEEEQYSIGSVPPGNYKSIKFNVGLSAATNASTPAGSDAILNQPSMWFGGTAQPSGFVFVNFQGMIDTTTDGNGKVSGMQPFSYKIGTDANLLTVTMPVQNYTVSPNQAQYIHMAVNYAKLLEGIQLNQAANLQMNDPAANATALGIKIRNNILGMFNYE